MLQQKLDQQTEHFRLPVIYGRLPGLDALEQRFSGQDSVWSVFDGSGSDWQRHESTRIIDEISGVREFWCPRIPARFNGLRISSLPDRLGAWNAIATMYATQEYRFAIVDELIEFVGVNPELQITSLIFALGSYIEGGKYKFLLVAGASRSRARTLFLSSPLRLLASDRDRVLLVRHTPSE